MARRGTDPTFIVGGDMAPRCRTGESREAILELCSLGVAAREGIGADRSERLVRELPGAAGRLRFFDFPRIDISSTLSAAASRPGRPCVTWFRTPSPATSSAKGSTR